MPTKEKVQAVAALTESFKSASGAVLTEYRGLSVGKLQELRRSLGDSANYVVVKNTLTKRALADAGIDAVDEDLLTGPTAIAFIEGDVVEVAKSFKEFAKENQALVIKGGILDGAAISPADFNKMADLESREVLLAKLAGAMKASMSGAAALFNAPLAQAARTIDALRIKAEADPSVLAAGEPAPQTSDEAPAEQASEQAEAPAEAPATDESSAEQE